ncbi:helicase C-terminal domain-containing protein [Margalitia sp. FSL K6-0131]|uniref:ATP-dependent DNA helicase n=1 Tax=Margalitia sp. FSL K6-0131 TaxID=2954604 RepID=UPI0030F60CF5
MSNNKENTDIHYNELVEKVFMKGGELSNFFKDYQPRTSQIKMAKHVMQSLVKGKHGLIEAGTGTGKSLGYSVAASLYALEENKTVVISTNTITLQNQLINKELPLVKKVIKNLLGKELSYSLAKGRGNFMCKRRLSEYIKQGYEKEVPHFDIAQQLAKKYLTAYMTSDYSKDNYGDIPDELWREIQSSGDDCLGKDSPFHESCFVQIDRIKIRDSIVIICNHALFFTDLNLKQKGIPGILPEYDAVIFDEGHRIEDVFSNFYQKKITLHTINRLFERLINRKSNWMKKDIEIDEEPIITLPEEFLEEVKEHQKRVMDPLLLIFTAIGNELKRNKKRQYLLQSPVINSSKKVNLLFNNYISFLKTIKSSQLWHKNIDSGLSDYIESVNKIREEIDHLLLNKDSSRWANWISFKPLKDVKVEEMDDEQTAYCTSLIGAPIESSTVLEKTLFKEVTCVITSATLTTAGDFDFISKRLGIGNDYVGVQIDSPFDYEKQAILVIPENAPPPTIEKRINGTTPKKNRYEKYVVDTCKEILTYTKGRTFILFTSYKHLQKTFNELQPWCEEMGITPIQQTAGTNREQMIKDFKELDRSVLFGAESFWEGVDIPGDDLMTVIICKIPFPVPSEPVAEARMEKLEREGKNPFYDYSLPIAILKIMQGFGRLIRRVTDSGAVIILDSRIKTKKYGQQIINSLPDVPISYDLEDFKKKVPKGD